MLRNMHLLYIINLYKLLLVSAPKIKNANSGCKKTPLHI